MEPVERHQRVREMLERAGVSFTGNVNYALYQLHEVDFIVQKVGRLIRTFDEETERDNPDLEKLGKALVSIKIELYDHLPDHLSDLRGPIWELISRLCEQESPSPE